jgi:peptidoglycan/xylan/chitin deacetylase (PgdA/CDA1 family)
LAGIPVLAVLLLCLGGASPLPPTSSTPASVATGFHLASASASSNGTEPYGRADGALARVSGEIGSHRGHLRHRLDPSHRLRVPILLYHVIGNPPPGTPLTGLWVAPSEFSAEMRFLAEHHYHVVTLQEAFDYWHGASLPSRPVVVSFDDGFRSDYTKARPILAAHGWAGTLNLSLSHLSRKTLTRTMVRGLIAAGWEIDSHSLTHAFLPGLDLSRLEKEIRGSRHALRTLFDIDANFFAYPFGSYDRAAVAAVRRAGYLGAVAVGFGLAWIADRYSLARIQIARGEGAAGLARKLAALGLP